MNATPPGVKAGVPRPSVAIPFQFRPEPVGLRESRKVSGSAVALFTVILDDAKRRGWRCRLSNAAMAARIGRTTMTVKRLLAELEAAGMVARDMIAGGRIRLAIVVTWEGVEHSRSADVRTVEHSRSTGGTSAFQGVEHSRSTLQGLSDREIQDVPFLPLGKDPGEVPDGPTAAAFLRAMIAKGNKPAAKLPTPRPTEAPRTPQDATPSQPGLSSDSGANSPKAGRPAPPPAAISTAAEIRPSQAAMSRRQSPPAGPRLDDPRREVNRMLDQLAAGFVPPRGGRRRLSPAELQRQLVEVRRRYGSRSTTAEA